MEIIHVETLREPDRAALCWMLEDSRDFPHRLLDTYRRGDGRYDTFVAWRGDEVVGVLTGSFNSDLRGNRAFEAFALQEPPHAFLDRIHVHKSARGSGVGRALLTAYAAGALDHGCTFVGGSIDLSSDPRLRRKFFERNGFTIRTFDNFGASPADAIRAIGH